MVKRMPGDARFALSKAHIFVRVLTIAGYPLGYLPPTCNKLVDIVTESIGTQNRSGRLWIDSCRVYWPEGSDATPNGLPDRTVWNVLVPQQKDKYDTSIDESLQKLAHWLSTLHLPVRIAVYNDGGYVLDGKLYTTGVFFEKKIEQYLGQWDVEIYIN